MRGLWACHKIQLENHQQLVIKTKKKSGSFHELMIVQRVRYPAREAMNDVASAKDTLHHIQPLHYMHDDALHLFNVPI